MITEEEIENLLDRREITNYIKFDKGDYSYETEDWVSHLIKKE